MPDLEGRSFLVTGAGGHVGRAVVNRLLSKGARVAGLHLHPPAGQDGSLRVTADVTREADVARAFSEAEREIGPLWGVLHIAGGWKGGHRITSTGLDVFEAMISTNLASAFIVAREAMRRLEGRGGRIVLVGSHSAATSAGLGGSAAYNVSKAGVIALTKALAEEGEPHGVYACCVAPNTIATDANRAAMPSADFTKWVSLEEVAEAIVTAASPRSAFNGAVLTLRGQR